jgi:ankyrin repeat protein
LAELLITRGAEVNVKANDGSTPLHLAAVSGHTQVAKLLLTRGAEVNAKDDYYQTPLKVAERSYLSTDKKKKVVELLKRNGGVE